MKRHEPVPPFAEEDGSWSFTDSNGIDHCGYRDSLEAWQAYDEFNEEAEES